MALAAASRDAACARWGIARGDVKGVCNSPSAAGRRTTGIGAVVGGGAAKDANRPEGLGAQRRPDATEAPVVATSTPAAAGRARA